MMMGMASVTAEPFLVAHRGASFDAPENTLPAFELAWERGADAIEGDFWLSQDGEIVCLHDKDTKKVAGRKLVPAKTDWAELAKLDVGAWKGEKWRGVRMPRLEDVLATVPAGKKIYVEVKCGPEILPKFYEVLAQSGLKSDQVVVISFNAEVVREVKRRSPEITANWLTSVKEKRGRLTPSVGEVLATLREIKADGVSTSGAELLGADYVKAVREAGFGYHMWTINEAAVARRVLGFGVMSVTTDRPGFIRAGLAK